MCASKRPFLLLLVLLAVASSTLAAAEVVIIPGDPPGEGFFDPTPALPVGKNPGTTVGQQALFVFQNAANIWGAKLRSRQPINVIAFFTPLPCDSNSGVLGAAGPTYYIAEEPGLARLTWYPIALAEKLANTKFDGLDDFQIVAFFNSELGHPGCLDGGGWYYGADNNAPPNVNDLSTVVLHEFGHGLGFSVGPTDGASGLRAQGLPSIWERHVADATTKKLWLRMSDAERAASAVNSGNLVWAGRTVHADAPLVLDNRTEISVRGPRGIRGEYEAQPATFGPPVTYSGLHGVAMLGYDVGGVSPTDGCEPLASNGRFGVKKRIVLLDRGTCAFTVKVKNAQNAGAVGVVIANNLPSGLPPMGGSDPTIVIPSVGISKGVGDALRDLARFDNPSRAGIPVTLQLSMTELAGSVDGRPRLYAPNPYEGGSSVSHWDTSAAPNLLMEPFINLDLTYSVGPPVDLTLSLLEDIGW